MQPIQNSLLTPVSNPLVAPAPGVNRGALRGGVNEQTEASDAQAVAPEVAGAGFITMLDILPASLPPASLPPAPLPPASLPDASGRTSAASAFAACVFEPAAFITPESPPAIEAVTFMLPEISDGSTAAPVENQGQPTRHSGEITEAFALPFVTAVNSHNPGQHLTISQTTLTPGSAQAVQPSRTAVASEMMAGETGFNKNIQTNANGGSENAADDAPPPVIINGPPVAAVITVAPAMAGAPQNQIALAQTAKSPVITGALKPSAGPVAPRHSEAPDDGPSRNQPARGADKPQTISVTAAPANAVGNSGVEQQNISQLAQTAPPAGAETHNALDKQQPIRTDTLQITGQITAPDRSAAPRITHEAQTVPASHPAFESSPPVRELAVQISQHMDAGLSHFKMRLDPAELGRVEVRMEISPEGKLTAVIAADRPETLDLLQRDARALERSLGDAGIKTDSGALSFSLRGGNYEAQQRAEQNAAPGDTDAPWLSDTGETLEYSRANLRFANRAINISI